MSCCASASTSAGTGCYIRYYVHQGCTQALSALPVRHSQHNFHPIPPKHRAFWACAKAALGSPVRPALMLPLCMAQVGSFDVWWAQAELAVIGRTSWGLMSSMVLMVAPATICSQAPVLSTVKASLRLRRAVQLGSGFLQNDVLLC